MNFPAFELIRLLKTSTLMHQFIPFQFSNVENNFTIASRASNNDGDQASSNLKRGKMLK